MILNETQKQRDEELSEMFNLPLAEVQKHKQMTPEALDFFTGDTEPDTEQETIDLYRNFSTADFIAYLRSIMMTSVEKRGKDLPKLLRSIKDKVCLDFGSGTGTHGIALAEMGNHVSILDVPGRLFDFARKRFLHRGLIPIVYYNTEPLPPEAFDFVVCTDVLEHVFDPVKELARIYATMKKGAILHLRVSTMVKNNHGHFKGNIAKWKKHGPAYLKKHFVRESKTSYRKRLQNEY